MRPSINLCLYFFSLNVFSQNQLRDTFTISCAPPSVQRQIISSDTTSASHSNKIVVFNVDKSKKIVSIITITDTKNTFVFDFNNLDKARYSTVYYDTSDHVIYETIIENQVKFHCYSFRYNSNGQLIYKEGYSSGEMGVQIHFEYDSSGKLVKEIIRSHGGTRIKHY